MLIDRLRSSSGGVADGRNVLKETCVREGDGGRSCSSCVCPSSMLENICWTKVIQGVLMIRRSLYTETPPCSGFTELSLVPWPLNELEW